MSFFLACDTWHAFIPRDLYKCIYSSPRDQGHAAHIMEDSQPSRIACRKPNMIIFLLDRTLFLCSRDQRIREATDTVMIAIIKHPDTARKQAERKTNCNSNKPYLKHITAILKQVKGLETRTLRVVSTLLQVSLIVHISSPYSGPIPLFPIAHKGKTTRFDTSAHKLLVQSFSCYHEVGKPGRRSYACNTSLRHKILHLNYESSLPAYYTSCIVTLAPVTNVPV